MKVILPAVFTRPVFRSDGSVKLEFDTREFGGQDAATLMEQRQKEGWLLFSPNKELGDMVGIPDEKADSMTGQKTQAQRLRGVIYRIWEKKGKPGDSESFYKAYMERLIEREKSNLD
ncbi:MAG TPA: hypothetical protein VIS56_02105 [Candidatus Saccharimonadales bacterium]